MTEKKIEITRCGICNAPIQDDEDWTETDCVICEACKDWANEMREEGYND